MRYLSKNGDLVNTYTLKINFIKTVFLKKFLILGNLLGLIVK